MEIEKKFHLSDNIDFTLLTNLTKLGDYTLRPAPSAEDQHNVYYDTATRTLEQHQFGLRIRHTQRGATATLKGPAQPEQGLHRREEWEVATDNPHPATWPSGPARDRALALLGDAPLQALLTIQTQRHIIQALRDSQEIAELALDTVEITAGAQTEQFCELEIELRAPGTEADLQALETALSAYVTLIPENRTKLQRGLALLQHTTTTTNQ